ncbi:hypothetical protein NPIL_40321 [Nephila pilipes]|uniref:Uncharacterized protein n=1 Tax=Nephila pilipes TaxID=299642 RepID=A0A8X6PYP1_NEPPI|nr:hypothetical protein NPIL_40321 [Nephila pilipes]
MDRMRAAVFSPIRNKSFEDHKQSDELPACNISKYMKGPIALKENRQKNSSDITSKGNKKTSGSDIQNKSHDKASRHKINDTSKSSQAKRRDVLPLSPDLNDFVFLSSSVENSSQHPDFFKNTETVIKNENSRQKINKHDQNKGKSSDKTLSANLTKKNDKDLTLNFVTVRNDKRVSQSETKQNDGKNRDILLTHSEKIIKPNIQTIAPSSTSSKDLDITITNNNSSRDDDKNNLVLGTDCSLQLQAAISFLQHLAKKNDVEGKKQTAMIASEKSESKNKKEDSEVSSSSQHCQPSTIQSTIIEKLINDTISYQFDGIRQQLYLQHASLCRTINSRMEEVEKQHATSNESLLKIIQELLEENRQLRTAILACQ